MGSRMDKYKNNSDIPKRSEKNKELYRQIYNAYDEFENLVVPSNVKEIDISGLKKEITSRDEYRKVKDYSDITNNKVIRKEIVLEEQKKENEIYDINELLNKAVKDKKEDVDNVPTLTNDSYLKKLRLDESKTNLDTVKDMYEDIKKETEEENESLLRTANLSLEILSDLKGDNDNTMIEAPIKDEFLPEEKNQFYSSEFKFSKKDFEDKDDKNLIEEEFYDDEESGSGKFFFKILLLIFGMAIVIVIAIYLISYFNRV
ncbi:MAG: hypothetical protein IJE89_03820 [Bacilli bacterium]|nr:hypothetical protein [Bacilli bacterium]